MKVKRLETHSSHVQATANSSSWLPRASSVSGVHLCIALATVSCHLLGGRLGAVHFQAQERGRGLVLPAGICSSGEDASCVAGHRVCQGVRRL